MGNTPSSTPRGAQSNLVNIPLACEYASSQTLLNTTVSFTTPISGSDIYYSNIQASMALPEAFIPSNASGPGELMASVNITINLEQSIPSSMLLYQTAVQDSADPIVRWQFAKQGPFALQQGQLSRSILGQVEVQLQYSGDVDQRFHVTCGGTRAVIASVQQGDNLSQLDDAAPEEFPPTQPGEKAVVFSPATACTFDSGNPGAFNLSVRGVMPVNPSGEFSITNIETFVTVPGDLIKQWTNAERSLQVFNYRQGTDTNSGGFPGLHMVTSQGGLSSDWSVDGTATESSTTRPLYAYRFLQGISADDLTFSLPLAGSLTIGGYRPENGIFSLLYLGFNGVASGYSANNGEIVPVGSVKVQCDQAFQSITGDFFSVYAV